MKSTLCFSLILTLAITASSYAAIIHVPNDFPTIQEGIDAAKDGDIVLVADGTYIENINFNGKAIVVKSKHGAKDTTIDGNQNGSVVTFSSGEGPDSVIEGFTLRNGNGTVYNQAGQTRGGGVFVDNSSSPIVRNNIITGNTALEGGGIYCGNNCSMTISDNIISDNDVLHQPIAGTAGDGGGIFIAVSSPVVIHNAIINNLARIGGGIRCTVESGISDVDSVSAQIIDNIISNNLAVPPPGLNWSAGGGIDCSANPATITKNLPIIINNTITNNSAHDGGGIRCANSSSTLINNILWSNNAQNGPDIFLSPGGNIIVTYSDVQGGWPGEGNIDSYPLFVDPDNGDYHLQVGSPCIDAGDPNSPKDPDGTRANMGAFYSDQNFNSVAITTLEKVSGDNQSGIANTTLPNPLVVKVLDQNRKPIKGVVVNFLPTKGAIVNPTQVITDDNGIAQTILTLNTRKGDYNITAHADGILPTTFTATATTGIIYVPDDYTTIRAGIVEKTNPLF